MAFDERLGQLAENYRGQGYAIVVSPGPEDLPDFAKDFRVELVGRRGNEGVLVTVKESYRDLQDAPDIAKYAEIIDGHAGWRFDVSVLNPALQPTRPKERDVPEMTDDELRQAFNEIDTMLKAALNKQAYVAAWSVLETVMRKRLRAIGERPGWGTSPHTLLGQLYSNGVFEEATFRALERLLHKRNVIVHGFALAAAPKLEIGMIMDVAQRLLKETGELQLLSANSSPILAQ